MGVEAVHVFAQYIVGIVGSVDPSLVGMCMSNELCHVYYAA